jgi:hypothetical protein
MLVRGGERWASSRVVGAVAAAWLFLGLVIAHPTETREAPSKCCPQGCPDGEYCCCVHQHCTPIPVRKRDPMQCQPGE